MFQLRKDIINTTMGKFRTYLVEQNEEDKLKHLEGASGVMNIQLFINKEFISRFLSSSK